MEKKNYEQSVARIEFIVKQLEQGDTPLEQSLELFEEATGLVRTCSDLLEQAKQQIVELRKGPGGEPVELPFNREVEVL